MPEQLFGAACGAVLKEFLELYKGLFKNSIYEGLCLRFHEIVRLISSGTAGHQARFSCFQEGYGSENV